MNDTYYQGVFEPSFTKKMGKNVQVLKTLALGRLQKILNFISISGKKLLFTFAKKMLSLKGKNSGAMSWLSAAQQRK